MNKRIRKPLKLVIPGILLILYFSQLYLAVQTTKSTRLPKLFGWGEGIFLSGSMSPAIETGSMAFLQEQKTYKVGDIITYRKNNSLITHRIVEKKAEVILVKGDANNRMDEPITQEMIEGKIMFVIPYAGTLIQKLKSPAGMACVAGGAMLIALWPDKKEDESDE